MGVMTQIPSQSELYQGMQRRAETDPSLLPHVVSISEKGNISPDDLKGASITELGNTPAVIDTQHHADITDKRIVGILTMGDQVVKLYRLPSYDDDPRNVSFIVARGSFDDQSEASEDAKALDFQFVPQGGSLTLGRETTSRHILGLANDNKVSRQHVRLDYIKPGVLEITDLESTNGTVLVTKEKPAHAKTHELAPGIGSIGLQEVAQQPRSPERVIDGMTYQLDGAVPLDGREMYHVTSTDSNKNQLGFFVYRSSSEGSLRVSQGFYGGGILMKGAIESPSFQYTQESQLHPKFATELQAMVQEVDSLPLLSEDMLRFTREEEKAAAQNFADQIEVYRFNEVKLAKTLNTIVAGGFGKNRLMQDLEVSVADIETTLQAHLDQLNELLQKADIVPDFTKPSRVENDDHPVLGPITREVYAHTSEGVPYEWYMASDTKGKVWIDRIRFAQAQPTAYGTDKQIVYSGILTSKPIDYRQQTSGLPDSWVDPSPAGMYEDITPFLDKLYPIQKYRQQQDKNRPTTGSL